MSAPAIAHEKPENPSAQIYANFLKNTEDHVLRVIRDDGLYRHLRFQEPGTRMWSIDLTTWPGHLATSGDVGEGLVFSREKDMIPFFARAGKVDGYYSDGAPSIDFRYWAEKIQGRGIVDVRKYDPDLFLQLVREHLEESEALGTEAQEFHERQLALLKRIHELRGLDDDAQTELLEAHWKAVDMASAWTDSSLLDHARAARTDAQRSLEALWCTDGLTDEQLDGLIESHGYHELADIEVPRLSPAERREEILDDARWHADSEAEAHKWLSDNEQHLVSDTWEWDLRGFDSHFLFACYCIDAVVRLYREHLAEAAATDKPQKER